MSPVATDRLSVIFGALADPTRRAILARLADGEATVNQLAAKGQVPAHVPAEAAKKYAIDDVTAAPVGETGGDS